MATPFDFVASINAGKNILTREDDPAKPNEYVPWVVNLAMSNHIDTILAANEINRYPFLPPAIQYEFLLNTVRPGKRYGKWAKAAPTPTLDVIAEYFKVNKTVARQYVRLLSQLQIAEIERQMETGGMRKTTK